MTHGRKTARKRALALAGASSLVALTLWPTSAQAADVFSAEAEAYPYRQATTNPTLPLGIAYEGYGPYAKTKLNSIGASDAIAAGPYGGEVSAGYSGLLLSVTGVQFPAYPFFLLSASGDDPQEINYPFVSLSTASGSDAAVAQANMGDDFSGADANARSERLANGAAQALAESTFDLVELGNNITIRGLHNVARVVAGADGELTRTTSLEFDSISAPGLRYETPCAVPPQISPEPQELPCAQSVAPEFAFKDGQFFVVGPDGTEQAAPLAADQASKAFAAIGVKMTYQEPQQTENGVRAGGLIFEYSFPEIPDNPSGLEGVTTQRFEIGFASASAALRPTQTSGVGGGAPAAMLAGLGILAAWRAVRLNSRAGA